MVSAPSRQKNGTRSEPAAQFARLLQSKAGIEPVTSSLTAAAERLGNLGVISFENRRYVRCALTEDKDFPYSNRTCSGRLPIEDQLDENAGDYTCPECGRTVHPFRHRKKQFQELRCKVLQEGVEKYVRTLLDGFDGDLQPVDGVSHVWRIDAGLGGVHICLADYCDHQRIMSVQWAQQNPTCYVAVNPHALERFADIDWLCKVMLADLIAGRCTLTNALQNLASNEEPRNLPLLATAAYSKGAHRPEVARSSQNVPTGLFVVELGKKTARVNGVDVLAAQARTAYAILKLLVKEFMNDLLEVTSPEDYFCLTPSDLATELQKARKLNDDDKGDVVDQEQVRRTINRLQEGMADRLRKAGIAAERDDIIQASPNATKEGYRLNPFKVAIRPLVSFDGRN